MELSSQQRELMQQHLAVVIEANKVHNLTRIDTVEDGELLHIEDSLTALEEIDGALDGPYADLGSGAGYPGIPLAIATGRQTTLVEPRKKKCAVLREIVDTLGLTGQVHVYEGRAELLAREAAQTYTVLTARALAKLSVLLELASPLLEQGGSLVCYKANVDDDEYKNAMRVGKLVAMQLVSDRELVLSDNETKRRILCFEKSGKPKVKLPRQEGFAQKKPL